MSHPRLSTVLLSAALAAAALLGPALHASAQVVIPTNRNGLLQQNELQMLQNRIQRQQYQQQQQWYREQDRQVVPKPQPKVPVFDPSCRLEKAGNAMMQVCR